MVSVSGLFSILYGTFLLSRIYATANAYAFPIDSSTVQMIYIGSIILLALSKEKKLVITKKFTEIKGAILLLVGYLLLFGFVFVNPVMKQYTNIIVQRQGLFLIAAITTALFARKYDLLVEIIETSFWTVAIVLCYQFITNIEDVAKINVLTIFDLTARTRANFGLGHYNFLGVLCACEIVLGIWLMKLKKRRNAPVLIITFAAVMLLGSASRNAIISLAVFALMWLYFKLDRSSARKGYKFLIKLLVGLLALIVVVFGELEGLLLQSNRMALFTVALPTFFKSGRTWIGLGLASSEIYGQNLTPYKTYWLDNGYIYTLVASGYIGAIIYLALIILFLRRFWRIKKKSHTIGSLVSATFVMYLFMALFEMTLFNGGALINYLFVPIFLIMLDYKPDDAILPGYRTGDRFRQEEDLI